MMLLVFGTHLSYLLVTILNNLFLTLQEGTMYAIDNVLDIQIYFYTTCAVRIVGFVATVGADDTGEETPANYD